jgi:hypothetical protein
MSTRLRDTLLAKDRFTHEFSGAGNLVYLTEGQAQRMAYMAWHRTDLSFTRQCLELLEQMETSDKEGCVEAEAFWRSSIVHYCKCFAAPQGGGSGRRQLDALRIYGKSGDLLKDHWTFMKVRNKQLVHDEGVYSESHVVAVIAPLGQFPKVQQVVVAALDWISLGDGNLAKLTALVTRCSAWAEEEFQNLASGIALSMQEVPHEELLRVKQGKMRFALGEKETLTIEGKF